MGARVGKLSLALVLVIALGLPAPALADSLDEQTSEGILENEGANDPALLEGPSESAVESRDDCVAGELIVEYDDAGISARSFDTGAAEELEVLGASVVEEVSPATADRGTTVLAKAPEGVTVDEAVALLSDAPGVASVQPNYLYRLIDGVEETSDADGANTLSAEAASVDDPLCNDSTAFNANQYYLYNSKTVDAWEQVQAAGSVTVAVLDTGCRLDHEDLRGTLDVRHAYDAFHETSLAASPVANGDAMGHGTHVCGIVAAQANNGVGMAGASYNANVLPVKVFDDSDSPAAARASTSDIVKAYSYLSKLVNAGELTNLHIVNLSLGYYPTATSGADAVLEQAIASMRADHNVLTVCAGGNGDSASNTPYTMRSLPSDFDECLAVTSLDRDGGNTVWSDYNEFKDISAPGTLITSASHLDPSGYRTLSGTSMASPLVAGIAALVWAADPNLSVDEVVDALESTADPVVDDENDRSAVSGSHGAVNARAAVSAVLQTDLNAGEIESAPFRNLVLLVRFAGDATGDGGTGFNESYLGGANPDYRTKWEHLTRQFNASDSSTYAGWGFRSYLSAMSGGLHDVVTDFPQSLSGGRVAYITLDQTAGEFGKTDDLKFIRSAIEKFNSMYGDYDGARVDGDGDGMVDNILIVPDGVSTSKDKSTPFYSHKAYNDDFSLEVGSGSKARTIGAYNIITASDLGWGVAAHEYLHTLGAKDYYRDSGNGHPVGVWDTMASSGSSSRLMAITQQQVGWMTIPQKEAGGTYVLSDSEAGGERAIMFKSPLNSSEYFVAEYRKKGSGPQELDSKIGGSGLIVYRVNPAYADEGNIGGNDYVYVFRPGETGLGDAYADKTRTNLTNAQISTASYATASSRTSIGSADLSASIEQGALCYSDGSNSGIVINAIAQTDDSITFDLTFPDYDSLDLWEAVANSDGTGSTFGSDVNDVQFVSDGSVVYVLVQSGLSSYSVRRYDGTDWKDLGVAAEGRYGGKLAVNNGVPYVVTTNYKARDAIAVKSYENGSWNTVANLSLPQGFFQDVSISFIGSDGYIMAARDSGSLSLYRFSNGRIEAVDETLSGERIVEPTLFELDGNPALSYGDLSASGSASSFVREYIDGSWVQRYSYAGLPYTTSIACDGGKTYVYQGTGSMGPSPRLIVLDQRGEVEQMIELQQFSAGSDSGSLVASDGHLYLSMIVGSGAAGSVRTYEATVDDLASWVQFGYDVYAPASKISSGLACGRIVVGAVNATGGFVAVKGHQQKLDNFPLAFDTHELSALMYGYQSGNIATFTLRNDSSQSIQDIRLSMDEGSEWFELGAPSQEDLAPGESVAFTCVLKTGLDAAMYAGRIRATAGGGSQPLALASFSWEVSPLDISNGELYESGAVVKGVAPRTYNAKPQELVSGWSVKLGSYVLGAPDVKLAYENNINAAAADGVYPPTVVVSAGSGNYRGSFKVTFGIGKVDLSRASLVENMAGPSLFGRTYSGKQQQLASGWTLQVGGMVLTPSNLVVSYMNNVNAGAPGTQNAPSLSISSRDSNFTGIYHVEFAIKKLSLITGTLFENGASKPGVADKAGTGQPQTLAPGWSVRVGDAVVGASDVSLSYRNNVKTATAISAAPPTVIVSAKSANVQGSFAVTFTIGYPRPLAEGIYVIQSALADNMVLDVAGGSASDGANVQLYASNMSKAQRFRASFDAASGLYTFANASSGKVLDVVGGVAAAGTNVAQYRSNGTKAQKWRVEANGNGTYRIVSALKAGLVLDVSGASTSNGANVGLWNSNGTMAQSVRFLSVSPVVKSDAYVEDGVYAIRCASKPNLTLDICGASSLNGANVQLWSANGTNAQNFKIVREPDGFYTITCVDTGKALDVDAGNVVPGTNVHQWDFSRSNDNQKWAITRGSDGAYSFISKANGLALDVQWGAFSQGSNVWTYFPNGGRAQKFALASIRHAKPLAEGIYVIQSALADNMVLDVAGGSASDGANVQLYASNMSKAQRFRASFDAASGLYTFANASSGKVLDVVGGVGAAGTNVAQYRSNGTKAQKWKVEANGNGTYRIVSALNPSFVLDVSGGIARNGSNVQIWSSNRSAAQSFRFVESMG